MIRFAPITREFDFSWYSNQAREVLDPSSHGTFISRKSHWIRIVFNATCWIGRAVLQNVRCLLVPLIAIDLAPEA